MPSSHEVLIILAHVMHPVVTQGLVPSCQKLGFHPIIMTDHPEAYQQALQDHDATVLACDVFNPLTIIRALSNHQIHPAAIVSNSDHLQTSTAIVAAWFQLPGKDWRLCFIAKHKGETRHLLRHIGLPSPWSHTLLPDASIPEDIPYPIVAKPAEGVASLDVHLCYNQTDLTRFRHDLAQRHAVTLQLEEYLEGPLFTVETWGDGNSLYAVGGFDVTLSSPPHFIERSAEWNGPITLQHRQAALAQLKHIGIGLGICHSEFIATSSGPVLVEINYRSIGDGREFCLDRLCHGAWFDGLISLHLGHPVAPLLPHQLQKHYAEIHYHLAEEAGHLLQLPRPFSEITPEGEARYHPLKHNGEMITLTHSNKDTLGILTLTATSHEALTSLRHQYLPRLTTQPTIENTSLTILRRVLDAALREDCCQIISQGDITPSSREGIWRLCVHHLAGGTLWLDVVPETFMQTWRVYAPYWWWQPDGGSVQLEQHADTFLNHLSAHLDTTCQKHFALYSQEIQCAMEHAHHCRQAAQQHLPTLRHSLTHPDWRHRLLTVDRIASYADHPLYPTARAKNGFTIQDLMHYAPEFSPQFQLHWIAVPKHHHHQSNTLPPFWPCMRDVGLPEIYESTHSLFPIHPLSWNVQKESFLQTEGIYPAPHSFLDVTPTLSVRTVALCADPAWHIKVPLHVATLGARNLRLIKPSTLHDGHTVSQLLSLIQHQDPSLQNSMLQVDESRYGYVHNTSTIAFLIRHYPRHLKNTTPIPVAALASHLDDGHLLVSWVVNQFYQGNWEQWARSYAQLFLNVHLRLWLQYGIALESNQQNAIVLYSPSTAPRLLMKDNDAARLWPSQLRVACPESEPFLEALQDPRLISEKEHSLGEMFCTITLQLCLAAPFDAIARAGYLSRTTLFTLLRNETLSILDQLDKEGWTTSHARELLLKADYLPAKYLMSAGSLFPKETLGISDINKFYGYTAPNFLKNTMH